MCKLSLVILFASICARAGASVAVARQAEELLALEGDQTGTVIKIAPGYLPERWNEAVAIYVKGKPSFACPANLGVRSAGDGWWEVFRREMPHVFTWTGEGGDARWGNPRNWTCDNAARANPCLVADLFGDWREEAMYRRRDNNALRINVSTMPTECRFWSLMEDPCYRNSVAAENAGYNVAPEPSFYFGPDLKGHGIWFCGTFIP